MVTVESGEKKVKLVTLVEAAKELGRTFVWAWVNSKGLNEPDEVRVAPHKDPSKRGRSKQICVTMRGMTALRKISEAHKGLGRPKNS